MGEKALCYYTVTQSVQSVELVFMSVIYQLWLIVVIAFSHIPPPLGHLLGHPLVALLVTNTDLRCLSTSILYANCFHTTKIISNLLIFDASHVTFK